MLRTRCSFALAGLALGFVAGITVTARADEPPAPVPPAPAAAAPAAAGELRGGPDLPPTSAGATTVANPQAPPLDPTNPGGPKSNKALKQEKQAELTPIVPSPRDVTKPAYQLFWETDLPLLGIGAVMAGSRLIRTQPAYCAPLCDRSTLNPIDRSTAGYWSVGWATASDVVIYSIMGGGAAVLAVDEGVLPALNDGVVIAESGLLATALSGIVSEATGRPRPYLYGDKAPLADRNSADAGLSFLSSHAAVSFAVVTSLYVTERRLHPGGALPYVILGAGLALASFVGTARVFAGKHFITDSVGGAVMGTSVGILMPALHGSPVRLVPTVTPKEGSVSVVGTF